MAEDLTCGETGSTAEDIINRVNEHDKSINNSNLIINPDKSINQRDFDGVSWIDGQYAYDRWKATATAMKQIVEDGNYEYDTVYTLSGINVTTQQITSPLSGHWTLPEIPRTATNIRLEKGVIATLYQSRLNAEEFALCQRYYEISHVASWAESVASGRWIRTNLTYAVNKRAIPTIQLSDLGSNNMTSFHVENSYTDGAFIYGILTNAGEGYFKLQAIINAEL